MYDFAILEKGGEIGGTWRDNIYPGIACDLPSITYSFSFEQNPNWSRVFAPGDEIQKYALHCVEKYELRQHLLLSTHLTKAVFDDSTHLWMMYTAASPLTPSYSCRFLISATGILTQPKLPDIPGLQDFKGEIIHTGKWDPSFSAVNKRVAIIGTGASSVQVLYLHYNNVGRYLSRNWN